MAYMDGDAIFAQDINKVIDDSATASKNSASAVEMVAAALTAKKVVTTAAMWSGNASPYTLTINDPTITANSWIDVYVFSNADKVWITNNLIHNTPTITVGNFSLSFHAANVGISVVYTVREVK